MYSISSRFSYNNYIFSYLTHPLLDPTLFLYYLIPLKKTLSGKNNRRTPLPQNKNKWHLELIKQNACYKNSKKCQVEFEGFEFGTDNLGAL